MSRFRRRPWAIQATQVDVPEPVRYRREQITEPRMESSMDAKPSLLLTSRRVAELELGQTLLGQLQTIVPILPRLVGITPAVGVLDTDLLLRDLKYALSHNTHTALMIAARTGLLRLYAALPIWYEVMQHIDDLAKSLQWDPLRARDVWLTCYAPWIYFIDAARLPLTDPFALESARRDPTDVQTAQLVIALTPDVFLSCNEKHFPSLQPVGEQWLTVSLAYRDKFLHDISSMDSTLMWSIGFGMGQDLTQALVRGITSLDRRVFICFGIGIVLIAVLASLHRPTREAIISGAKNAWAGLTDAVQIALPPLLDLLEQAAQRDAAASYAQQVLSAVRRGDAQPGVVRDFAATALARTDAFLPVHLLQSEMTKWGYATDCAGGAQYVRRVLRGLPSLFREDGYGRWGLSVLRALPQAA
jgi:hypothetical protein